MAKAATSEAQTPRRTASSRSLPRPCSPGRSRTATMNAKPSPIQTAPNTVAANWTTAGWRTSATADSQKTMTSIPTSGPAAHATPPWCTAASPATTAANPAGTSGLSSRAMA